MELKKTVCYEDFGAVGDGVTDDVEAIRATHAYANENKIDVVCQEKKTYYIGAMTKAIPILTNVNWGESTFIVDDRDIAPDYKIGEVTPRVVFFFTLPSPGAITIDGINEWMEKINASGGIKADSFKQIEVDFGEKVLLRVYNEEHRNYIRYGVNQNEGGIQRETVVVDKDGYLDENTPFMFDYAKVTRVDAFKIDVDPIVVEGGTFITYPYLTDKPQGYTVYERGIYCDRSNVTFRNIKHYIEKEGTYNYDKNEGDYGCPYDGFFSSGLCNNVLYENCVVSAHLTYKGANGAGMGTYDIMARGSINITYKNCVQENDNFFDKNVGGTWRWGVMGSSGNKGIAYIDSNLTRFDAHGGVYNPSLVRTNIKYIRLNGAGTFLVEGCKVYNKLLVSLREDYGGSWDGDVIIKDVTMETYESAATLFSNRWYNHYFGFPIYMPETIIIDNLQLASANMVHIFDPKFIEQLENASKDEIDGKPNLNKVVPPKKIIIKNNTQGLKFIKPETEYFKNTEIVEE